MTDIQRAPADAQPSGRPASRGEDLDDAREHESAVRRPGRHRARSGQRKRGRQRAPAATLRRRRRRTVVGLLVLPVVGALFLAAGMDRVWNSTVGRYVDPGLEPDEPSYTALVTPSPTLLLVHTDDVDELASVALLSLRPNDEGGAVILLPVATQADVEGTPLTLGEAYADGGSASVEHAVRNVLNVVIGETEEVDDAGWDQLVAPVAPLSLTLPEAVGEVWPAGSVELDASDVGLFLQTAGEAENELNRTARHELFWEAWVQEMSGGDEAAVPDAEGEEPGGADVGIGRFLEGLASGPFMVSSLPVVPGEDPGEEGEQETFTADADLVASLVAEAVPYPTEPAPGGRVRVRLLNGTSQPDLTAQVVEPLVRQGAEIAISGNASSFDEPRTRFVYTDEDQEGAATWLRAALGVGRVELMPSEDDPDLIEETERIDVTVILGADAPAAIRRLETTG